MQNPVTRLDNTPPGQTKLDDCGKKLLPFRLLPTKEHDCQDAETNVVSCSCEGTSLSDVDSIYCVNRWGASAGPNRPLAAWTIVALLLAIGGCTAPPQRQPLPLTDAARFSNHGETSRSERWWESFSDPRLAAHIERGLASNFSLRGAYERLQAARAVARQQSAPLWPSVDTVAGYRVFDGNKDEPDNEVSVGLEASYEVDLWGRVRKSLEAEQLAALATAEDYQAAAVGLSAAIATVLYRVTESAAQLALIESQLETNRNVLQVIESRFAIGQSGSADVLRQRQLVEATVEQRVIETTTLELLEHQLAVLEGNPPQGMSDQASPAQPASIVPRPDALPTLPGLPAIGLPAELLERRPDVRAAYARLESSDASVAAAARDRYPRIDLAAAMVYSGEKPSDLFSSWVTSLAGQIVAPLVDGGRRQAEVDRAVAERRQRLAEYGDVVLVAFREVEDALVQERRQTERIASLQRQSALARSTYAELRNQYMNGAADFIDVLSALREQQALARDLLAARQSCIEFRIALHRAIAGGFAEPADEATPRPKEDQ